jgi:hypothetical protein
MNQQINEEVKIAKKLPAGLLLFSLYFIVFALFQIGIKLLRPGYYDWYSWFYQAMPGHLIFLRYVFSISFRVAQLIVGIGILFRKEIFRKLVLCWSWIAVAAVYWKHPFDPIYRTCEPVVRDMCRTPGFHGLDVPLITKIAAWGSLVCVYAFDIGFSALMIYYFTRPGIKDQFKHPHV